MKAIRTAFLKCGLLCVTALWSGCGTSQVGTAGDDQNITAACTVFNVKLNRNLTADELSKLKDPVAQLILSGASCPTSFQEIQAKLRTTDSKACKDDPKAPPAGVQSRLVTNRSQLLNKPDDYRAVVSRTCGGRESNELLMSVFGIRAGDSELPGDLELIGQDKTRGVFDYYAREENKWKFFGSSEDLIGDGYNCNTDGACVPKAARLTRCASCHPGGGLNMKELHSPWTNWEGSFTTPGLDELYKTHGNLLGARSDGIDLEGLVTTGNGEWVLRRLEFLKGQSVEELLRPLFCTVDLNIQYGQGSLGLEFFIDDQLSAFEDLTNAFANFNVSLDDAKYKAQIKANGQFIGDSQSCGPPAFAKCSALKKGTQGLVDTVAPLAFPIRSAQDDSYVQALLDKKVVTKDFVRDVLMVDFTRPIFSPTRCSLAQFAPKLDASKITAAAILSGFKTGLAGKTGAAAELLKALEDPKDAQAHFDAVKKYADACNARATGDAKALLEDVLATASARRNAMRRAKANLSASPNGQQPGQGVIEFAETLPFDAVREDGLALDPVTCKRTLK